MTFFNKECEIPSPINADLADVRAIMQNAGSSLMGIGTAVQAFICIMLANFVGTVSLVVFNVYFRFSIEMVYSLYLGKSRARDAALNAIQSPLLDIGLERAAGIVWNITGGSDLTLFEVTAVAEVIYDLVDTNANLILEQ
ncbi:hypothetical protein MLD38_016016 [Melastoma candidum]|uniref:Uncharacterized protein n=1 Tax=Melastoma candidum TaxID=119954 RepID=A0ACB9RHM1_9MYRT|nr:hypothetical protein MLD38_016016 [Melastoma candidum]